MHFLNGVIHSSTKIINFMESSKMRSLTDTIPQWFAPTIFSTIDGVRVLSVIHSELSRIASELIVIFPPLQVAID